MVADNLPDDELIAPHLAPVALGDRLRARLGDRAVGIVVALGIELLLLLILLTLGQGITRPGEPDSEAITAFDVSGGTPEQEQEQASEEPAAPEPQPQQREQQPQPAEPTPPQPVEPSVTPVPQPPAIVIPRTQTTPLPAPSAAPAPPRRRTGPRPIGQPVGPPQGPAAPPAGGGMPGDTQRVGTAPNGEPMYAARWYREPRDGELAGYLSTAQGPAYGLITCRTVQGYRVEDCVGLEEQPAGSNMLRAVLAAAWQFRVRPPRLGGKEQFGTWVRIRIDYSTLPPR